MKDLMMKFTIWDDDAPQIYLNPVIEKIALKYNFTILQTLKAMQDGYNYYMDEGLEWSFDYEAWKKDVYETFGFWIMPKGGGAVSDSIFERIVNLISSQGIKTPLNSAFIRLSDKQPTINLIEVTPPNGENDMIQIYILAQKGWYYTPGLFIFKVKKSKAGYFLNWVEYPFANPLQ